MWMADPAGTPWSRREERLSMQPQQVGGGGASPRNAGQLPGKAQKIIRRTAQGVTVRMMVVCDPDRGVVRQHDGVDTLFHHPPSLEEATYDARRRAFGLTELPTPA